MADRVACDAWDVKRRVNNAGRIRGILRPAYPDLLNRNDVIGAVQALVNVGIEDIAFYNYGHVRQASLDWMADALSALD